MLREPLGKPSEMKIRNLIWGTIALVAGTAMAVIFTFSIPAWGESGSPGYTECGFVEAKWLPDHAPRSTSEKHIGVTSVPEGWTVVGGDMGVVAAMMVCR